MRPNTAKSGGSGRGPEHVSSEDQQRFAAYAADMAASLARVAREHKLDTLAYLLEMARLEAQSTAGGEWEDKSGLN